MPKFAEQLAAWTTALSIICMGGMALHIGLDILLRAAFGVAIRGTGDIVAKFYMPFIVFGALAQVQLRGTEIRVDLIEAVLSPRLARILETVSQLVVACVSAGLSWYTALHAQRSFLIGERIELGIYYFPIWPGKLVVTIGFAALALCALARAAYGARPRR